MPKLKQMVPTCVCGQLMYFPVGKTEFRCPRKDCGAKWECGPEGYWATRLSDLSFTPIFAKRKLDRYNSHAKWMKKSRKAGRK